MSFRKRDWISLLLIFSFCIYLLIDGMVGIAHKCYAEDYWNNKEPEKLHIYSIIPLTNIPVAVKCWIEFNNPVATWKLLENQT